MSQERYQASSWSGSEKERRPQGTCLPPSGNPNPSPPKYFVPKGTPVQVRKLPFGKWQPFVTTKDNPFETCVREDRKGTFITFESQGYHMRVSTLYVRRR